MKNLRASSVGERILHVLLVDDRTTVRKGLRMRLELEPDLKIVGEAGDGAKAIAMATKLHPDLVLMDVQMPVMDGIEAAAALHELAPEITVVMLTLYDDARTRARAREAGAAAFIAKHRIADMLLETVRTVAGGAREEFGEEA